MADIIDAASGMPKHKTGAMMPMNCLNCNKETRFLVPQAEPVNGRTMSALVFAHEEPQACEHCGQLYIFQLAGLGPHGLVFGFVKVEAPSSIVAPPPGLQIPRA